MSNIRLATVWLDGCSGCHMSLLDTDERLLELAQRATVVYSPLVDTKTFPEDVDVALVEGAVGSVDDLEKIRDVRRNTATLVAFGDCALHGNVAAMRNTVGAGAVLQRAYVENAQVGPGIPADEVPRLLDRVRPLHEVVPVDVFLPGCPPPADLTLWVLTELCDGRRPDLTGKFRHG